MITFPRYFKPSLTLTVAGQTFTSLITSSGAFDCLRTAFSIRRSMTPTPDSCSISIRNIEPVRRAAMSALLAESLTRIPLVLQIGYDGTLAQAFAGDVRTMQTGRDGGDVVTSIVADDGGDAVTDTTISLSTLGLTARDLISVALKAMAGPPSFTPITAHPSVEALLVSVSPVATLATYTSVMVGKATGLLDEAARALGARWWIRDLQLFMAQRNTPTDQLAVLLPRTHWLSEPSDDGGGVMHVTTFADPNLTPGRQVAIEGRDQPGLMEFCRVEAVDLVGDTHGSSPWSASLDLRRLL